MRVRSDGIYLATNSQGQVIHDALTGRGRFVFGANLLAMQPVIDAQLVELSEDESANPTGVDFADLGGAGEGHVYCFQQLGYRVTANFAEGGGMEVDSNRMSGFLAATTPGLEANEPRPRQILAQGATTDAAIEQAWFEGSAMGLRFMGIYQFQTEP